MNPFRKVRILGFLVVGLAAMAAITTSPGLALAALCLLVAQLLALWAIWPTDSCDGELRWRSSESGDIHIGICDSCGRWQVVVRGSRLAYGRGFDTFKRAASEVANRYESAVPHISMELRRLIDRLSGEGEDEEA